MLDAFIIEQLKKNEEQGEWRPVSLPMELPVADVYEDMLEEIKERENDRRKKCVLQF